MMLDENGRKTTPKVKKGITSPGSINPAKLNSKVSKRRRKLTPSQLFEKLVKGDRIVLGQAITLIESQKEEDRQQAHELIEKCLALKNKNKSIRIGITGSPGVGKSTYIEAFGNYCIEKKMKVAVLAVDPTSQVTKGSILGDKTRMATLSSHKDAFIRPSPARDALGGVAEKTRESILLCEAAGFKTIIIETVGVGQSETMVHGMVDFFLLLISPAAGDELQGIKRGIVEMADLIAVNKADGDLLDAARHTKKDYYNALHLFPPKESGWIPKVMTCSAIEGNGIPEIWAAVIEFQKTMSKKGVFQQRRKNQSRQWLHATLQSNLQEFFFHNKAIKENLQDIEEKVIAGKLSSSKAAELLLGLFTKSL